MENKAKKMFEDLGYEQFCNASYIEYFISESHTDWKNVRFNLKEKTLFTDSNYEAMNIDMKTFEAIYQQLDELGWLENKPLEFDDLKEDMWIWDNQTKRYMKIFDISYSDKGFNVNGDFYLDDLHCKEFKFEENRFFRKEVKK